MSRDFGARAEAASREGQLLDAHDEISRLRTELKGHESEMKERTVAVGHPDERDADVPAGARVLQNEQPLGFAANANRGFAETSGEFIALGNFDGSADGSVFGYDTHVPVIFMGPGIRPGRDSATKRQLRYQLEHVGASTAAGEGWRDGAANLLGCFRQSAASSPARKSGRYTKRHN